MTARAAVVRQNHDHQFGEVIERDRHDTIFGEVAVRGTAGRQTWVGGLAIERDAYTARDVPRFDYTFTVPGAFAQYDITASQNISLSASARLDVHSEYGTFFSPRVSALAHAGRWTSRLSVGTGFFGPTPITEETEAAGLTRLEVRLPLEAERGLSASFDVSRTDGPFSYTATLFASRINDPLHVERSSSYVLSTLPDPTTNVGLELLGTLRKEPFSVTATYTYVRARETVDASEQDVPLTPRHSAGIVGMWEAEDVGRVGIEWDHTGRQSLEENPYRAVSEPYMILGLLAEKQFGRIRVFLNGENLTGVPTDKMGSAPVVDTGCGWPLDRRCVGAARRAQRQRRASHSILSPAGTSSTSERASPAGIDNCAATCGDAPHATIQETVVHRRESLLKARRRAERSPRDEGEAAASDFRRKRSVFAK